MIGISNFIKRMTAFSLVIFVTLGLTLSVVTNVNITYADSVSEDKLQQIDAYIMEKLEEGKIPGLSIAIVKGEDTVLLKGYGKTGNGNVKLEANTPFVIGTITKSFTSLAIQQLISSGKIELSGAVELYIPEFDLLKPDGSSITIEDLLKHTSGLSSASGEQAFVYKGTYNLESLTKRIIETEQSYFEGSTEYQYSNLNTILLGRIIEVVSGSSYEEAIQNQIFDPLGMNQSGFDFEKFKLNGLAQGHRIVYGFVSETNYPYPSGLVSSSYMMSSAADLARFLKVSLNNGYYTESLLSNDSTGDSTKILSLIENNILEPIFDLGNTDGADTSVTGIQPYYDVIWQPQTELPEGNYNGFAGVIGTLPNYNSVMLLSQENQVGIVVLVNQANQYNQPSITAQTIANDISDILIDKSPYAFESQSNVSLWLIPLLALVLVFMMFSSFRKTRLMLMDTREKVKILPLNEAIKGFLSLTAYFGFPLFFDNTWGYLTGANPEYALPILVIIVFNLLTVIANFTIKLRSNHKRSMRYK